MDREIALYKSKRKARTIIGVCIVVLIAGVIILINTDKTVAGWSILLLSVFGLIFGISTFFERKPVIVMDESGISERSFGNDSIEWGAMKSADPFHFRGQYYIRIITDKNYKPSLPGNRFYRLDRLNDQAGIKTLYLKISMVDANPRKLLLFIREMMKADLYHRRTLLEKVPGFR